MHVVVVKYGEQAEAIRAVREAVFVEEQGVPLELERDDRDTHCLHVVAFLENQAVGTARLDTDGRLGRMAVLAEHRGLGIGSLLVDTLHGAARSEGLETVWCHVQTHAIPFYERFGYEARGEEFVEAGIPHREMFVALVSDVSTDWEVIASFSSEIDAQLAASALENAGVSANLSGTQTMNFLSYAGCTFRLSVPVAQKEDAQAVLAKVTAVQVESEAERARHCPSCQRDSGTYVQRPIWLCFLIVFTIGVWALLFPWPRYNCQACGHRWR